MRTVEEILLGLDKLFSEQKMAEVEPYLQEALQEAMNSGDFSAVITIVNELIGFLLAVPDFLGYCFGDFYTRDGLNDQQRELITFTFIATLGGCENQLRGHTQGNLSVGNDKEKLVSVITIILPYIGFPRSFNALAIINEICD